jgi:hypothetical protein
VHEAQWSTAHSGQPGHPVGGGADLAAVEFSGVRYLKLLPLLIYVGLGHRESLVRCRRLAVRDPGELHVFVHGQVDHLACSPGRPGQPAQRRPFIVAQSLPSAIGSPNSGIIQ